LAVDLSVEDKWREDERLLRKGKYEMKKLIIVLAIVLSFGFATSGFAEIIYYGKLDNVSGGFVSSEGDIKIFKNLKDAIESMCMHCPIPAYLVKIIIIDPGMELLKTKAQKEKKHTCFFVDRDGKETEIECK
jgi:hypothetical protein